MNKVILIGNLTKHPEVFTTKDGKNVCKASIAVQCDFTNADGEREADFFNVVVFGNKADYMAKYIIKGNKIAVCGRLQNRSYEDRDGNKRTVTEVIAEELQNLTKREIEPEQVTRVKKTREMQEVEDDDLPF